MVVKKFVICGMVSRLKMNRRGALLNQIIVQIVLVVLIFSVLLMLTADKINARGVKQEVVEGELALLIDSAIPGMSFSVWRIGINGAISNVQVKNGRIFVSLDGLNALKGHAYFSRYDVSVEETDDKFMVMVK